ncbi:DNA adenine methylase [Wolbachia endosymbiont (group A) of Bibio marci]|uniref:DNA adenine methylase n=1 Tax=Wolbachia endosymbiont (group A) of Bibio marci TaxID=2953987 RepID=UPI002232C6BD|nr:DNA adenine methylase [Wolbachia endosymbiont (group A) of Bibio marci]
MLVKSPLRYPGGKSRAVSQIINKYIPKELSTLCSPFIGGGSIELALASRGTKVYGYDAFEPLVRFWQVLLEDASYLAEVVRKYQNMTSAMFYSLQKTFFTLRDRVEIAAAFFALNRTSFSGTTLFGGMSPGHPRFTLSSIERLAKFSIKNLTVDLADFKKSIPKHANDFLYCDPPYLIDQKLYGRRGTDFDHEGLAKLLSTRDRWVLSYNDCEEIRDMYTEHRIITPKWTYGMGNSKKSNEILILSKDYRNFSIAVKTH